MNQGKLEVVKQEMARVNIDILGISELKWTGMGGFNSDDQECLHLVVKALNFIQTPREWKQEMLWDIMFHVMEMLSFQR